MKYRRRVLFTAVSTVILLGLFIPAHVFRTFEFLENGFLDIRYGFFSRELPVSKDIAFIAIDDASLETMGKIIGEWPWPRGTYIAHHIVDYVMTGLPALFLFDLPYFEMASKQREETISEQDKELIAATMNYGAEGKLSHAMEFKKNKHQSISALPPVSDANFEIRVNDEKSTVQFPEYNGYSLPFPNLNSSCASIHSITQNEDRDGINRENPIIIKYNGRYYPSLALRALEGKLKLSNYRIMDRTLIADRGDGNALRILLSRDGGYRLTFAGDLNRFTAYKAADVIASSELHDKKQKENLPIQPEEFRNKIVVIGITAAGLKNGTTTPLNREMPGSYFHLTAISNILLGQDPVEAPLPAAIGILAGSALFLLFVTMAIKNRGLRYVFAAAGICGFIITAFLLFRFYGILIDMSTTLLLMLAAFSVSLAFHTIHKGEG